MSFIKKSVPPPEVKEGQVLVAKVVDVEYPVDGQYGKQVRFSMVLPNGYKCSVWMRYYEEPSDRSALGTLSITFMNAIEGPVESVKQVLEGIKRLGSVYVKCSGFREYNEQLYPKFEVVSNKLPPIQKKVDVSIVKTEETPFEETMSKVDLNCARVRLDLSKIYHRRLW